MGASIVGTARARRRGGTRGLGVGGCVLALALSALTATAGDRKDSDRTWSHPELERFVVPRIALLPVVPVEGGLDVCPFVEKRWAHMAGAVRGRWLPTVLTRSLLERGGHDSLLTRVAGDVLRSGRVDSTTAPPLARALGVRGLMTMRLDLWRRQNSPVRGMTRAAVVITASLVDSSGTLLWTATGRGEHDAGTVSQFTEEFGTAPADYDSALTDLFGRWLPAVSAVPSAPAPNRAP